MTVPPDPPSSRPPPSLSYETTETAQQLDLRSHDRDQTVRLCNLVGWVSVAAAIVTLVLPLLTLAAGATDDPSARMAMGVTACSQPILNGLFALVFFILSAQVRRGGRVSVWFALIISIFSALISLLGLILFLIAAVFVDLLGESRTTTLLSALSAVISLVLYCKLSYHAWRVIVYRGQRGAAAQPANEIFSGLSNLLAPYRDRPASPFLGNLTWYLALANLGILLAAALYLYAGPPRTRSTPVAPTPIRVSPPLPDDPFRYQLSNGGSGFSKEARVSFLNEMKSQGATPEDLECIDALLRERQYELDIFNLRVGVRRQFDPGSHKILPSRPIDPRNPLSARTFVDDSIHLGGKLNDSRQTRFIGDAIWQPFKARWKWTAIERVISGLRDRFPNLTSPQLNALREWIQEHGPQDNQDIRDPDALPPDTFRLHAPDFVVDAAGNIHYVDRLKPLHISPSGETFDDSAPLPAPRVDYLWATPQHTAAWLIVNALLSLFFTVLLFRIRRRPFLPDPVYSRGLPWVSPLLALVILMVLVCCYFLSPPISGLWIFIALLNFLLQIPQLIVPFLFSRPVYDPEQG